MGEVVLQNVWKRYGKAEAVKGLSFEVKEEECIVILGPSGAGKTSTLKMIAGLEDISDGEIYINGTLVNKLEPNERDVAMTFEAYALYPHFSVYDNLAFPLRSPQHKLPEGEIEERVTQVAEMLGIAPLLDRHPAQLSQGQKQRVGLGRTLVRRPSVFLFDEPLAHVDAKIRNRMRMEIKRIQEELRTTSIFVTHDYLEALALGDRIVVLDKGVLQQIGTPKEIFDAPANQFVAEIVGDPPCNLIDVRVVKYGEDIVFRTLDAHCQVPVPPALTEKVGASVGEMLRVGIRPMYVTPSLMRDEVCIEGSVYVFQRFETRGVLEVQVGDARVAAMTAPDLKVEIDQKVWLSLDPNHLLVFDPQTGLAIAV
jgi:multiple sugar transport system ATP-binding protein